MTIEYIPDIKPKIIDASLNADTDQDWENINNEIESLKSLPDHNLAASELLKYIQHENSQVRDAVVSSLVVLDVTDQQLLNSALNFATKMATDPSENIYSSGRSAMLLHKYENLPQILESLSIFKQNATDNNWKLDLIENIPGINVLL